MTYAPTDWVDGVTPVNAANLDKIEAGIAAAVEKDSSVPAGSRLLANYLLAGDTEPAFAILGNGYLRWGPGGTTPPDTVLQRIDVGSLYTNAALSLAGPMIMGGGAFTSDGKFFINPDGSLQWGPGDWSRDTHLYRAGAGLLQTDGNFKILGGLQGGGRVGEYAQSVTDWDDALSNGWYMGSGIANQPVADGNWYIGQVFAHNTNWVTQRAWQFTGNVGSPVWERRKLNGTWFGWQLVGLFRIDAGTQQLNDNLLVGGQLFANHGQANQIGLGSDGSIYFGLASDTKLFRRSANDLKTEGVFRAGASIVVEDNAATGTEKLYFSSTLDTNLYRSAPDTLKTDDSLEVAGTLKVGGVPVTPGGGGVDYIGDWGAGTAYKKGDVVRHNGNDYMAVNDSTGATPPAAFVPPIYAPSYGTTLPASPVDGQEAILVDSLTVPTYAWRFRYCAGISDAYKWVFVGGAPYTVAVEGNDTTTSGGYTDLPNGPSLIVPRAGIYHAQHGAIANHTVAGAIVYLAITVGAGGQTADQYANVPGTNLWAVMGRAGHVTVASPATALKLAVACAGGTATYAKRHLSVTPVRVA